MGQVGTMLRLPPSGMGGRLKTKSMSEKKKRIEEFRKKAGKKNAWEEKARFETEERGWLDRSYAIAIEILAELHRQGKKRGQFADELGYTRQYLSKVLKGKENLSLRTIHKLEEALGKKLIHADGEEFFSKEGQAIEGQKIRVELGEHAPGDGEQQGPVRIKPLARSRALKASPDRDYARSSGDQKSSKAA